MVHLPGPSIVVWSRVSTVSPHHHCLVVLQGNAPTCFFTPPAKLHRISQLHSVCKKETNRLGDVLTHGTCWDVEILICSEHTRNLRLYFQAKCETSHAII